MQLVNHTETQAVAQTYAVMVIPPQSNRSAAAGPSPAPLRSRHTPTPLMIRERAASAAAAQFPRRSGGSDEKGIRPGGAAVHNVGSTATAHAARLGEELAEDERRGDGSEAPSRRPGSAWFRPRTSRRY